MAARGAALHFNKALVYSPGHTRKRDKNCSVNETQDPADKLEVMVLVKQSHVSV